MTEHLLEPTEDLLEPTEHLLEPTELRKMIFEPKMYTFCLPLAPTEHQNLFFKLPLGTFYRP